MEDLSRNLAKAVKVHKPPKLSKRAGSWSILFLWDHGKIISIRRPKALLITLAIVLVVAIVSFFWLLIVSKNTIENNKNLSSALDISRQKVMSLRDEKDLLMVRLVVAESKVKNKDADISPDAGPSVETRAASKAIDKPASLPNKKQVEEKTAFAKPEKLQRTSIEDFIVSFEPDTAALKVRFKIVNTSQNAQRVSGHAFVMLKQIEADKKSWLTFPSVPLVSGKPALFKKGQYFSILRFKIMKFKTGNVTDSEQFKTATVFVFSTTGELLLEKSFPVEIKEIVSSQT